MKMKRRSMTSLSRIRMALLACALAGGGPVAIAEAAPPTKADETISQSELDWQFDHLRGTSGIKGGLVSGAMRDIKNRSGLIRAHDLAASKGVGAPPEPGHRYVTDLPMGSRLARVGRGFIRGSKAGYNGCREVMSAVSQDDYAFFFPPFLWGTVPLFIAALVGSMVFGTIGGAAAGAVSEWKNPGSADDSTEKWWK